MILPISVIIPTMNRPDSLDRTLKHISNSNDVPQQIIVVDQSQDNDMRHCNESILNSYDIIESKVYLYQPTPSLTKARNNGFARAKNEIIVCSDDDVDVPFNIFTNIATMMKDEKIAMIASVDELTQQSNTPIGYILGTKSFVNRKIGHVTLSMLGRYPDNVTSRIKTQWAQGFFFVVRRTCMERWQIRWDENLSSYAYAEDLDFSFSYYKAAKREGLLCVLDPTIRVKHLATLEYRVPNAKSIYMYILNRKYLAHKHKTGIKGMICRNWCELWRFIERLILRKDALTFLKAYLCKIKYRTEINSGILDYDKYMK